MVVTGCARQQPVNVKSIVRIPANLPMSKIAQGMSKNQINSIMGAPNDSNVFRSSKQFIPFYQGHDFVHVTHYYKDQGRITFGGNHRVIDFEYDPEEDGWK